MGLGLLHDPQTVAMLCRQRGNRKEILYGPMQASARPGCAWAVSGCAAPGERGEAAGTVLCWCRSDQWVTRTALVFLPLNPLPLNPLIMQRVVTLVLRCLR